MKKNRFLVQVARRVAGVLALLLIFGLVLAGCGTTSGHSPSRNQNSLAEARAMVMEWKADGMSAENIFQRFKVYYASGQFKLSDAEYEQLREEILGVGAADPVVVAAGPRTVYALGEDFDIFDNDYQYEFSNGFGSGIARNTVTVNGYNKHQPGEQLVTVTRRYSMTYTKYKMNLPRSMDVLDTKTEEYWVTVVQ